MQTLNLSVGLVVTPGVLMLGYAGPADALRMAGDMGAALLLLMHICGPFALVNSWRDTL